MNRSQLVKEVATIMADKSDAERAVRKAFDAMTAALNGGEKVVITGFGAFSVKLRSARTGRNPKTGETVTVGPRKSIRFKPSGALLS
ncbi:MAG: HU family DNA-binding protein [Elusimicrobiales bacterium]